MRETSRREFGQTGLEGISLVSTVNLLRVMPAKGGGIDQRSA